MNSGIVSAVIGATCIAFAPIFVKISSMSPTTSAFYRCFLAAVFGVFFLAVRHPKSLRSMFSLIFSQRRWIPLTVAGLAFSLDLLVWHRSVLYAGAGVSTLLANSQVFYLAFIGWLFFKEPLDFKYILIAVVSFSGLCMAVYFSSDFGTAPNYLLGVVLGLLAGLLYSTYIVSIRWAERTVVGITRLQKLIAVSSAAAFFLAFFLWLEGGSLQIEPIDWIWATLLAIVCQLIGWVLIAKALASLDLSVVGLIILLQPVLAFAIGHLYLNESGSLLQYVGLFLTLLGIYIGERYRRFIAAQLSNNT
ncbi:DMT family transporter [Oligoflexaceae bacterium]|nr:DMT family transporter [Oligoflexaceae bacterium]